ncbi:MAG: hypothetical protein NVS4B11_27570 [Ktedonobacteraceae bacterium]
MNEQQVMELITNILGMQPIAATHMTFGHNSVTYDKESDIWVERMIEAVEQWMVHLETT